MKIIKTDKRIELIDVIKGIAILLMVIGHCIQYGSGNHWMTKDIFYDNFLFKFIYSFHMPLFMIISGYLFLYSVKKYSFTENFNKRITTLLIPIFSWSFIYNAITSIAISEKIHVIPFIKQCLHYAIGHFWFLWALFYCSIVVLIVNHFFKDCIIIYLGGFLLTFIIPDHYNLYLYKFVYPFFIIGYITNKYKYISQKSMLSKRLLSILSLLFVVLLLLYSKEVFIYISHYYILNYISPVKMVFINLFRFLMGLLGCFIVINWISIVYKKIPTIFIKFLSILGRNTLGIYIISGFIFPLVLAPMTSDLIQLNYVILILETMIITIFSIISTLVLKRIKITNIFLLGGRK